ncbi:GNAT family N-acetyltransferase [Serinicoccus profundi]|uniref:GNAT family N-acetyltransferase n=1 Tax=Serinicoccus profundi TaxID=1078471 RepID=UPI000255E40F|nr:GNAT family N-acetyltransferase [Serinicoccus profundi]
MTWSQVDRDELLRLSDHDPFVRFATSSEIVAVAAPDGWACVGPWRPGSGHWGGAAVVGASAVRSSESQALAAIVEAGGEDLALEWFSTSEDRPLSLPGPYASTGSGHWSFMWTEHDYGLDARAELSARGLAVHDLDDHRDAALIESFGAAHSDGRYMGFPGFGFATAWLAVRDRADDIVAVGALHELASGMPHLAGIIVRPDLRGHGLGGLLTQELTARAVEEAGVSTLSVFTDNAGAIALYERLGYAVAHRFHTRELAPAGHLV